jgi:hypothetical protein
MVQIKTKKKVLLLRSKKKLTNKDVDGAGGR